jgi:hypothetical protein
MLIETSIEYADNVESGNQTLHPTLIKRIMVTDHLVPTTFHIFNAQTKKFVRNFEIQQQIIVFEVEFPHSLGETHIAYFDIPTNAQAKSIMYWIENKEDALLYKQALAIHEEFRSNEIAKFLKANNIVMDHAYDFVTHFAANPSITANVKTQGRAPFSVDKAPRSARSAALKMDVEVACVGIILGILHSCNEDHVYTKWSINKTVYEVFKKTKAYDNLLQFRMDANDLVINQMRRWFPFCKLLAARSNFFSCDECPDFGEEHDISHLRPKWMRKLGPLIFDFMKEWIRNGEKAKDFITIISEEDLTLRQWYEGHKKEIDGLVTPSVRSGQLPVIMDAEGTSPPSPLDDECQMMAEAMKAIDMVRVQTLTKICKQENGEAKTRKAQRQFQALAQNMVSHKRNFKSLIETMEKMSAILFRIQSLEKGIHQNMEALSCLTGEDDGSMDEMQKLVAENFRAVEEAAKDDMKESLEPVAPYLMRRKRQRELDDFIGNMITYLEDGREEEEHNASGKA